MFKTIIRLLVIIVILSVSNTVDAQKKSKPFTGTINFEIKFEGRELDPNEEAQMPTDVKITYGKTHNKTEQISAMGSVVSINDKETMSSVILFDMMGQKMAIKSTKEETEKALIEDYGKFEKIVLLDETKTIAGYKCNKAEVYYNENIMTVYYTNEIKVTNPNATNAMFKDIKGVLLEFTQPTGDKELTMKIVAKEVNKGRIKKSIFSISSDYQEITKEEFKNMIGG